MHPQERTLSHDRLFEASEAALAGAMAYAGRTGRPAPYPADLVGTPGAPDCLAGFEKWEIEAACTFLVRIGVFYRAGSKPV
jgi:hypothetical protein